MVDWDKEATVRAFMLVIWVTFAGQQISAQQSPSWRLTEQLRIGSMDEDTTAFGFISGIRVDARANIYVATYPDHVIRVFDPSGRLLHSFGRTGNGPGEFQSPTMMGFHGDTLVISDYIQARVSLFTKEGRFAYSFPMPRIEVGFPFRVRGADDVLPDGSMVVDPGYLFRPGLHMRVPLIRVDRSRLLDTIAVTDFVIKTPAWREGGRVIATAPSPFRFNSRVVVSPSGTHAFVLDRPEARRGGRAQFVIHKVQLDGDTIWTRSYDYRARQLTRADIDSTVAAESKKLEPHLGSAAQTEYRKQASFPKFWPAFQTAITTHDGGLWIKTHEGSRTTTRWLILDADGKLRAQMHLPPGVDPKHVSADAMVAVVRDELDVPYVVRYRIQKGAVQR